MADELKYLYPDDYFHGVTLRDGVPVLCWQLATPQQPADEPALLARIKLVTGCEVRRGHWRDPLARDPQAALTTSTWAVAPCPRAAAAAWD